MEWVKARARKLRWQEEVELLPEEVRRSITFFHFKATEWEQRALLRQDSVSPEVLEGLIGYAHRQAHLMRRLASSGQQRWERATKVLLTGIRPITIPNAGEENTNVTRAEADSAPRYSDAPPSHGSGGNGETNEGENGETNGRGNRETNERGNGETIGRGNGETNERGNGETNERGNGETIGRGNRETHERGNGETHERGNGETNEGGNGENGHKGHEGHEGKNEEDKIGDQEGECEENDEEDHDEDDDRSSLNDSDAEDIEEEDRYTAWLERGATDF